jgi:hypothetical protein
VNSNMHQVAGWIERFIEGFNFCRPGKDQSLGRDLANTVIRGPDVGELGGIMGRCAEHVDPEGNEWAPNAPDYAARKEKVYGIVDEPNRRTGQMLSELTLGAKTKVTPKEIEIRPGLDAPPSSSAAPTGYLSKQDAKTTDTDKIRYAHTATEKKPAREFYAANEEDAVAVAKVAQENLNDYLRGG